MTVKQKRYKLVPELLEENLDGDVLTEYVHFVCVQFLPVIPPLTSLTTAWPMTINRWSQVLFVFPTCHLSGRNDSNNSGQLILTLCWSHS